MTLAELAYEIEAKQRAKRLADHTRPWQPSLTPATDLGYRCERRSVYHRVRPMDAASIGEELASIFAEGDLHQQAVRAELAALGYEVVESEVNFRDERLEITGTIDGRIAIGDDRNTHTQRRVPIEIKSTSGVGPSSAEEWRESESPLLRRYYAQLQTYLYLTASPEGLALFKSKLTGLWRVVAVALDYEYAETLLQRAERIRDAVVRVEAGGEYPERIADRSECGWCPWRDTLCHPAEAPADPLLLAEDEGLGAQLDRRAALDESRREYAKLDASIKERFKLTAGERFAVAGRWLVRKKKHGNGIRIDIKPLNTEGDDHE